MQPTNKKVKDLDISQEELEKELAEALGEEADRDLSELYDASVRDFDAGTILQGKVIQIIGDDVLSFDDRDAVREIATEVARGK